MHALAPISSYDCCQFSLCFICKASFSSFILNHLIETFGARRCRNVGVSSSLHSSLSQQTSEPSFVPFLIYMVFVEFYKSLFATITAVSTAALIRPVQPPQLQIRQNWLAGSVTRGAIVVTIAFYRSAKNV